MSNQAFNLLAPESWKSARARNVSQTIALDWGGCQEVKTRLNPIWHRNPGSLREPGTCRRPLLWIGVGLRRSKQYLARLAPESLKSASARNVSQTIALDWGGSQEVKTILSSFGTVILKVCECSERVADH